MTDSGRQPKPTHVPRKFLLDRPSQLSVSGLTILVVGGIGLLYGVALYHLLDPDFVRAKGVEDMRHLLLLVHTGYFLIGGTFLLITLVLLTHRFVGPARVVRQAIAKMRAGDFTARLNLRRRDYHGRLAAEVALLRDELAAREGARARTLRRIERCLETHDTQQAHDLLRHLLDESGTATDGQAETASTAA